MISAYVELPSPKRGNPNEIDTKRKERQEKGDDKENEKVTQVPDVAKPVNT